MSEVATVATAPDMLSFWVERCPDKVLFDFVGDQYSYGEFDRDSDRYAGGLAGLGVGRGDRVCFMLDNHYQTALVWFAIMKRGAVAVPINTAYSGEFLRHQVADSQPCVFVVEAQYADKVLRDTSGQTGLDTYVVRGEYRSSTQTVDINTLDAEPPHEVVAMTGEDTAMLLYTSGTTGPSKGCVISHEYLCNAAQSIAVGARGMTSDDVLWTAAPMFHMGCLGTALLGAMTVGATISLFPKFSVSQFWSEIERSKATMAFLISIMVPLIAQAPDTDVSKRCFGQLRLLDGTPLGPELRQVFHDRFGIRHAGVPGYGLTEALPVVLNDITRTDGGDSSGRRWKNFDVKIVDDDGRECPPGVPGVICAKPLRPRVMMDGYWNNPAATEAAFRDGWFLTGDIGKFDEQGRFYFVDRAKDYLRRGGENISSFEMEVEFARHPALADVAVHSVISELSEDEVKLTAVLKDGHTISPDDLCRWAIERIPSFAVPRYIEFRETLPRNQVGRVLKYELRDEGVTAQTWDRQHSSLAVRRRPLVEHVPAREG